MIAYYSTAYATLLVYHYDALGVLVFWDSEDELTLPSVHRDLSEVRAHYTRHGLAHNIIDDTGDA